MPRKPALLYAWLGGLAFTGSLAYFVYFYAVVLGQAIRPERHEVGALRTLAWDIALFGTFAMHHSVMARTRIKQWITNWLPPALERSTYVWIASALFSATCFWWRHMPGQLYAAEGLWRWFGHVVQLSGLVLIVRSASMLDVLELAGIRQVSEAMDRRPLADGVRAGNPPGPHLRCAGPYRMVRHPLYLGWALVVFGVPDMTTSRLLFACISTVYLVIAIPWEERSMVDTFGDSYRQYAKRVRWRLIPGVY